VACPTPVTGYLERELPSTGWPVLAGRVWTTDAPYRETPAQLGKWADEGVLAVEMQAASLFAFGTACKANVAVVAMVSNAVDHQGDQFDTGTEQEGYRILQAIGRAAASFFKGR
jgi:uridine phosphorylase